MTKSNQIIFMKGKELALDALFSNEGKFAYLAIGYNPNDSENGFEDNYDDSSKTNGFMEIDGTQNPSYSRIPLQIAQEESPTFDPDTGKVLKKYKATLSNENIGEIGKEQYINQFAIVDSLDKNNQDTNYYCATTFNKFLKTNDSSLTFLIGFML